MHLLNFHAFLPSFAGATATTSSTGGGGKASAAAGGGKASEAAGGASGALIFVCLECLLFATNTQLGMLLGSHTET
jgi:hypothetical protein